MGDPANLDTVLEFINRKLLASTGSPLSAAEELVIHAAWHNRAYNALVEGTGINADHLKCNIAPSLWKKLTAVLGLGQKIGKRNFVPLLQTLLNGAPVPSGILVQTCPALLIDQPPNTAHAVGRRSEVKRLTNLSISQQMVQVLGMAGSGKSVIAAMVFQTMLEAEVNACVWIKVYPGFSFEDIVTALVRELTSATAI
ncbi:MAG: NB-ARC domain-containing protein, partial [Thermosynechococcaceae cyanobacterium]